MPTFADQDCLDATTQITGSALTILPKSPPNISRTLVTGHLSTLATTTLQPRAMVGGATDRLFEVM